MTTSTPTYEEIENRLRLMEEMVEKNAQLTIANQHASSVMHEVNNPLEAMVNLVYLLQHDEPLPPRAGERVEILEEQLQVLTQVARSALSYSRDQARLKPVDVIQVAESALKLHVARITDRRVAVNKRFRERAQCHGISGELLQLLSNLILNALDATADVENGTLHIRVCRGRSGVHITVADNGAGVPEHVASTLFTPNVTSKQHGTGLGLWLSKRILQRHNGAIRMRTSRRPGKSGTIFRVTLPPAQAA